MNDPVGEGGAEEAGRASTGAGGLRVLQVAHGFPPLEHAGAELCALWLSQGLQRRGHEVEVFARTGRQQQPVYSLVQEQVEGVAVHRLRTPVERAGSLEQSYLDPRVRELFTEHLARGFDVVHIHHLFGLSMDLIEACAQRGVPCVVTLHDFWYQCPRGQRFTPRQHLCQEIEPWRCALCIAKKRARWAVNGLQSELARGKWWRRPLNSMGRLARYARDNTLLRPIHRRRDFILDQLRQASLVLSPSRFVLEEHRRLGLIGPSLEHCPNGIETDWAAKLPEKTAPAERVRFGFMGSFLPSKGIDLLVEAFQGVPEGQAELHLHGTSSWDGGAFFEALRKRAMRADVHFHGAFSREELPQVLANIDVLVVPSRWFENAPVTLDEAALARTPVIATDHGGMKECVEARRNGLLFAPDDAADLQRAMRRFIEDRELWSQLREPALAVCTVNEQVEDLEHRYRALIREGAQQGPRRSE